MRKIVLAAALLAFASVPAAACGHMTSVSIPAEENVVMTPVPTPPADTAPEEG